MSAGAVAGYVGKELLAGAISFVGGELLRRALGYPSISDVRLWIHEAIAELKEFVSEELQRQLTDFVKREMEADLAGILNNLYHYANLANEAQQTNRFLLENTSTRTANLIPRSLQFDQAYFVTTTAIAYRFFTLYALYKLDGDTGHIESAKPMVDRAVIQLALSRKRLSHEMSPEAHFNVSCELKDVKKLQEWHEGGPRFGQMGRQIVTCFGTKDGRRVTDRHVVELPKFSQYSQQYELDHLKQRIEGLLEPLMAPMRKQARDFDEMADSSVAQVIHCYDGMCQNIGTRYTPPPDAGPVPKIKSADVVPDLIEMPGATVRRNIEV